MQPSEGILIALVVVLIVVVAYQGYKASTANTTAGGFRSPGGAAAGGCAAGQPVAPGSSRPEGFHASLADAQREAWYQATANGATGGGEFDPSASDAGAEVHQYHSPAPGINYQDALVDSVADPRMRAQHTAWYGEVGPKSQTAMVVDNMDEAAAVSNYQGHGLYAFRFAAPTQNNPLHVTDMDKSQYREHSTKFSFGG